MKKISLIVLLLSLSYTIFSQELTLGPRFGLNMGSITNYSGLINEDYVMNGQLLSIHFGAVAELSFSNNFSIQTELLFSQKGHKLLLIGDSTDFSIDGFQSVRLNYFEIPVLARYSFGGSDVGFFINAGPYWGSFINAKEKIKYDKYLGENVQTVNDKFSINDIYGWNNDEVVFNTKDLGLIIGAGFKYNTGPGNFIIDFRYNISYRDLNNWLDETNMPENYKEYRARVFSISFAYLFWL